MVILVLTLFFEGILYLSILTIKDNITFFNNLLFEQKVIVYELLINHFIHLSTGIFLFGTVLFFFCKYLVQKEMKTIKQCLLHDRITETISSKDNCNRFFIELPSSVSQICKGRECLKKNFWLS